MLKEADILGRVKGYLSVLFCCLFFINGNVAQADWTPVHMLDSTRIYKALHYADMDGDGRDEAVVGRGANGAYLGIDIWKYNLDSEAWELKETITGLDYDPHDITTGDFNKDGKVDIAVGMRFAGLRLFINNGGGSWTKTDVDGTYSDQLETADFDNDGNLDIFERVTGGGSRIFYGNGQGGFTSGAAPSGVGYLVPADVNHDGLVDLIGKMSIGGHYYLRAFLNQGNRVWADPVGPDTDLVYSQAWIDGAGDINKDGFIDFVTEAYNAASNQMKLVVFWGGKDAAGNLTWTMQEVDTICAGQNTIGLDSPVSDVNGDGNLDIVISGNTCFNGIKVYYGNGKGGFSAPEILAADYAIYPINARGDYNGDGIKDIIFSNWNVPGLGVILSLKRPTGVTCVIEPTGAVDAGAQWKLTTGPDIDWHDSGYKITNLPPGRYTVKFKSVVGWGSPASQAVTVVDQNMASVKGTYTLLAKGSVTCTIDPLGAINAGAMWMLTTGPDTSWHMSDEVLTNIPVGKYIIKFKTIAAWEKPANVTVQVVENGTASGNGVYTLLPLSSVTCAIQPSTAVDAGAQWKLTSGPDTAWHNSGDVVGSIPIGKYTIRFKGIVAWAKPDDISVTLVEGQTTQANGEYTILPLSSVTCTIQPPDAVAGGAQWKLTSGVDTAWHNSGDVLPAIPIGNYTIKFKDIYGWTAPANQNITVVEGVPASTEASYTQITAKGAVSVTVAPSGAIDAGAQWKLTVGPDTTWHNSGETITDVLVGSYTVAFKNVYGWTKAANQKIVVTEGNTTNAVGTYEQITAKGLLSVTITPPGAVTAGAQWKLTTGPDTAWHNSGDVISDLCIGKYTLKFKTVYGWTAPDNQSVEIQEGVTTTASGAYTEIIEKGSVSVTITPPAADTAGARWKLTVGPDTAWHASGETVSNICVGSYTVKFKNITGWTTPQNQTIQVTANTTANTTGVYEVITQYGSVSVTIIPQGAADDGAQWRMATGADTDWHNNTDVIQNIPVGAYGIQFREIATWTKPADQTVEVVANQTATATGEYVPMPQTKIFGVSDVKWGTGEPVVLPYNEIDAIPDGVPSIIRRVAPYMPDQTQISKLSFKVSSRTSSVSTVTVEIYSVVGDTVQEDQLVTTLVSNQPVTLDPDAVTGGYSKYFQDFTEWDGKVNGKPVPVGFYKVKVSTQETSNWEADKEYQLSDNLTIIPRRFLKSPFVRPPDPRATTRIDLMLIGQDLDSHIISGLYPQYSSSTAWPMPMPRDNCGFVLTMGKLKDTFRYFGLNAEGTEAFVNKLMMEKGYISQGVSVLKVLVRPGDIILSAQFEPYRNSIFEKLRSAYQLNLWHEFYNMGLSAPDVWVLMDELADNGYVFLWPGVEITQEFLQLQSIAEMDVSPFYYFAGLTFDFLKEAALMNYSPTPSAGSWQKTGHCRWWSYGDPLLEGPIYHGRQEDKSYFEGMQGGVCYCGQSSYPAECQTSCQYCNYQPPGSFCGTYGHAGHYWGEGNTPIQENIFGYLRVPVSGHYKFRLYADDQGTLSIGGTLQFSPIAQYVPGISGATVLGTANSVNNNTMDAEMDLNTGYYPIAVNYQNSTGPAALRLYWNLQDANNQNFIFTDPTFIQQSQENNAAFESFLDDSASKQSKR